jgi:hypothetical protein
MQPNETTGGQPEPGNWGLVALAWIAVGIPLGWGVFMTFQKAVLLFHYRALDGSGRKPYFHKCRSPTAVGGGIFPSFLKPAYQWRFRPRLAVSWRHDARFLSSL